MKIKVMWGTPNDKEKIEANQVIDEIDDIFTELNAFIKVNFGEQNEYINRSRAIRFDTYPLITNDVSSIQNSWVNGMHLTASLLKEIKAEVVAKAGKNELKDKSANREWNYPSIENISNSTVIIGDGNKNEYELKDNTTEVGNEVKKKV